MASISQVLVLLELVYGFSNFSLVRILSSGIKSYLHSFSEPQLSFSSRFFFIIKFIIQWKLNWPCSGQFLVLQCFIYFAFLIIDVFLNWSAFVALCTLLLIRSSSLYLYSVSTVFLPLLSFSLMEAKRSQSISNCVHLYEALPTTKSVPMLLHTVSSFLPGISSGNSACSHRLSGKVDSESCMCLNVCDLRPAFPSIFHYLLYSASFCVCCNSIQSRKVYVLTRT